MIIEATLTLADLRKRTGLSQPQVAKKMGVSRAQVSRIEAMYPNVMFTTLRRYLDALDTEIRFTGGEVDGVSIDLSSSDIDHDSSRIYSESRKKDPTRAGQLKNRT